VTAQASSPGAARIEMVRLTSRGARAVIWMYFISMAVLAVWTLDDVRSPYPTLIAIVLFGAICVAVTRSATDRISLTLSLLVIAVGVVSALLVSWQLLRPGGYAQWYFGAAVAALFFLSLRGRVALAWVGFGLVGGVIVVWGLTTGMDLVTALVLVAKQTPILIVGTLFATALRRTGDQVRRFADEAAARAITEGEQLAISQEREFRLHNLGGAVSPMLELLARGEPTTPEQRLEFALAEAELRDSLRARALSATGITSAAREARRRGVEVILLDDSDPAQLSPGDLAIASLRIGRVLSEAREGRVTARLLPPGRAAIATIVVDGAEHLREDVVRVD
jgi:hypothetical protein